MTFILPPDWKKAEERVLESGRVHQKKNNKKISDKTSRAPLQSA